MTAEHWLALAVVTLFLGVFVFRKLFPGERPCILVSLDVAGLPSTIVLSESQAADPEIRQFCEHLSNLKTAATGGRRELFRRVVLPWWMSGVFVLTLAMVAGAVIRIGLERAGLSLPGVYPITVIAVVALFLFFQRSVLFNPDVRRAQALLLRGDAQTAVKILDAVLAATPANPYANSLMTIAKLMRCELDLAEELAIERLRRNQGPLERCHRTMGFRLWGYRHDDSPR